MLILEVAMTLSKLKASLYWELLFAASEKEGISMLLKFDFIYDFDLGPTSFNNIIFFLFLSLS